MASWLTLLLLARPLFATLRFPLTMPYVRPQLPQVTLCGTMSSGIVDVCYKFWCRASPTSVLEWLSTYPLNCTSPPSPRLPQGTRSVTFQFVKYLENIFPKMSKPTQVHHLMVIGCSSPVSGISTNLWNCGGRFLPQ